MKALTIKLLLILGLLPGCAGDNVVTREEIEIQNKADAVVSGILFDHDLNNTASYNIRKNGLVVIKFDASVSKQNYTEIVNLLRSSPEIYGVQAEQSGVEVCPLHQLRSQAR